MMGMLILGHRGSSKRAPENTLRSFQYAFEEGADGIELDVFLSKDGHLVVTHDENLKTLIGINVWTRRLNLSELKKLDFGDGEKIPTLDEVFENFGQKFKIINVEIRSTGIFSDGVEKKLAECIRKFNLTDKIYVSSFNVLNLNRMKKIAPEIKRGLLIDPKCTLRGIGFWIRYLKVATLNLETNWATEKRLQKWNPCKIDYWIWTLNDPQKLSWFQDRQVTGIITDYPSRWR